MTWTVTFYNQRLESEILAFSAGFLARFLRYAERMEAFGPDLSMPHTPSNWRRAYAYLLIPSDEALQATGR